MPAVFFGKARSSQSNPHKFPLPPTNLPFPITSPPPLPLPPLRHGVQILIIQYHPVPHPLSLQPTMTRGPGFLPHLVEFAVEYGLPVSDNDWENVVGPLYHRLSLKANKWNDIQRYWREKFQHSSDGCQNIQEIILLKKNGLPFTHPCSGISFFWIRPNPPKQRHTVRQAGVCTNQPRQTAPPIEKDATVPRAHEGGEDAQGEGGGDSAAARLFKLREREREEELPSPSCEISCQSENFGGGG